jgi:hypothetical protein
MSRPVIERQAEVPSGMVFRFGGRFLRVVKTYGRGRSAPVIVEEMASSANGGLKGQLGLWATEGVMRASKKGIV